MELLVVDSEIRPEAVLVHVGGEIDSSTAGELRARVNEELVTVERVAVDGGELRRLVERHLHYTGSAKAAALLERWESEWRAFWRIAPRSDVARIEDEHEGTGGGVQESKAEARA